ncbi:hypothetical protein MUP79_08445 [Candidatus Bathyarchaeota archaeon]|nr:hypothetical protein [Candidatus Bathyarchaeota archaeon]
MSHTLGAGYVGTRVAGRVSTIGSVVFLVLFAVVVLTLSVRGVMQVRGFAQICIVFISCILTTLASKSNRDIFEKLGILQLFMSPLLLYTLVVIIVQIVTTQSASGPDLLKNTNDTFFHAFKDIGVSSVHSVYLLLAIPFGAVLAEKLYHVIQTSYYFMLGEQRPRLDSTPSITLPFPGLEVSPFVGFWSRFSAGFERTIYRFAELARYLVIVYSLSFLSIAFLWYWRLPPTLSQSIPEPALTYWTFMNTLVAGTVWALYLLRKSGNVEIEKFYLRFFFSFLIVAGSVSALVAILAPDRLPYLTLSLPPITLIGIMICMVSLRQQAIVLLTMTLAYKVTLFALGAFLIVVPSVVLTYSPLANYFGWVMYLWSSSAIGLGVYVYLLCKFLGVRNPKLGAILFFVAFEVAYVVRLCDFTDLANSALPWAGYAWVLALVVGLVGSLLWCRYFLLSLALMVLGWIAYQLFSGDWFYALILIHGIALSYVGSRTGT